MRPCHQPLPRVVANCRSLHGPCSLQAKDGTTALHNAADQAEGHDDAADQLELRLQAAKLLLEAGAEPK